MDPVQDRRRLEAGDWVVATGPAAATARGLGKLTGGEYDPQDGALTKARVELAAGVRWIDPGRLHRVEPDDEVALAAHALELELVPEPRATALKEKLARVRVERGFVRTPGLLDAVWAALDDPLGAPGLVEWFEAGGATPRRPEPRGPQPIPFPRPAPDPPPRSASGEFDPQGSFREVARPRPQLELDELVRAVLYTFGAEVVCRVAADLRVERGTFSCLQEAIAATVTLPALVAALTPYELETACTVTGCGDRLMEALAQAKALELPRVRTAAPVVRARLPEAEAVARILDTLSFKHARQVATRMQISREGQETHFEALRRTRPALRDLLPYLGVTHLVAACRACGVSDLASGDAIGMRNVLLALVEEQSSSPPPPPPPAPAYERLIAALERSSLDVVVELVDCHAGASEGGMRAAILAGHPSIDEILARLTEGELARLAHRCGIPPADRATMVDALRRSVRPALTSEQVVLLVFGALEDRELYSVVLALGVLMPCHDPLVVRPVVRLLAHGFPLEGVLRLLTADQLRRAARACDLACPTDETETSLRERLRQLASGET